MSAAPAPSAPIDMADKTLSKVLELLGWTHTATTQANRPGRHVIDDQGRDHGIHDYQGCVALLRRKGLVA